MPIISGFPTQALSSCILFWFFKRSIFSFFFRPYIRSRSTISEAFVGVSEVGFFVVEAADVTDACLR